MTGVIQETQNKFMRKYSLPPLAFFFLLAPNTIVAAFARTNDSDFLGIGFHSLTYACLGISCFVIGFFAQHSVKKGAQKGAFLLGKSVRILDTVSVIGIVLSMLASICFGSYLSKAKGFSAILSLLICLFMGFSAGWEILRCAYCFCKLETHLLLKAVFGSGITECLLTLPQAYILSAPLAVQIGLTLLVCGIYCIVVSQAKRYPEATGSLLYTNENYAGFQGICLSVLAYGFVFDLRGHLNYGYESLGGLTTLIAIAVFIFMWVWVFYFKRNFDFTSVLKTILIAFATCAFLAPVLQGMAASFADSIMGAVVIIITTMFYLLCAYFSRHSELHPFMVFGLYYGLYGLPRILASIFVTASAGIDYLGGGQTGFFQALIMLILVIAVATALITTSSGVPPVFGDYFAPKIALTQDAQESHESASVDQRFELVAGKYGLNERETQTMKLICHGRSKSYIADTLYVSENSVKAYTKSLYLKLDVHSKQGLIDLVDSSM